MSRKLVTPAIYYSIFCIVMYIVHGFHLNLTKKINYKKNVQHKLLLLIIINTLKVV